MYVWHIFQTHLHIFRFELLTFKCGLKCHLKTIARRSVHVPHYNKNFTNFNLLLHLVASVASFFDFTNTFSWVASNASLIFYAPMTKQNHNICHKGPGPNLPHQQPWKDQHIQLLKKSITSIMLHLRRQDLSVPSNYFVHKAHSECGKKIVAVWAHCAHRNFTTYLLCQQSNVKYPQNIYMRQRNKTIIAHHGPCSRQQRSSKHFRYHWNCKVIHV
jgi:hypothetical protein